MFLLNLSGYSASSWQMHFLLVLKSTLEKQIPGDQVQAWIYIGRTCLNIRVESTLVFVGANMEHSCLLACDTSIAVVYPSQNLSDRIPSDQ
jgi:hypothetical protein